MMCRNQVRLSYPAVDSSIYLDIDPVVIDRACRRRGIERDGYLLFLSRIAPAKGVDDLIEAYRRSAARHLLSLVVAGTGPALGEMRRRAAASEDDGGTVYFFDDVDDAEKPALMAGCSSYVLPSKPVPEFVETFGIALVEKMLAGGGPIITTRTGGIPEAVGDTAIEVPAGDPVALADAIDRATLSLSRAEREAWADKARSHALQFDRHEVFDRMMGVVPATPAAV
jgi:glycosyltransferase involved in cell wall biosynthesis